MSDFTLSYTSHIGIRWIIDEEVIPKNESFFFQHAKHFASNHFLYGPIQDGRKDYKLYNKIEVGVNEREPRSVAAVNLHPCSA